MAENGDAEASVDGFSKLRQEVAPLRLVSVHYYLEDVYEELGPTKFIPGEN